ncbi:MAG: hypothetical protein LBF80_01435 [Spirochaetaceae bacterium]|nr:hypothetical protein [Spirochaetaceae bacterium]
MICLFALSAFSCRSIAGLLDKAGNVVDGSAFDKKKVTTYKIDETITFRVFSTREGENHSEFTLKTIPYLKFYGTAPDENGIFSISRVHFLFGSTYGWLEGDIDASATGNFVENGSSTVYFFVKTPIVIGEITSGGIRNRGRRIYGEPALTELRGRWERIAAAVSWMRMQPEHLPDDTLKPQKDFENYWQPILFPETVRAKLRPPSYTALGTGAKDYAYGAGIRWNAAYTRELLPEQLRPLRDNGSLFRDWEESVEWFYVWYYRSAIETLLGN